MTEPVKARRYRSPVRAEQAAATRRAVLVAARELFTTTGYAGSTVADVARVAGVSVDTVYASVGRKPELLLAVHDMALGGGDEPVSAQQRDYVAAVLAAHGARAKLETYAAALAERFPSVVPLAESLRVAAEHDPACRAVLEGLDERRAANMRRFAAELRATGEVRPELTDEQVAHLLWATNSPAFYRLATSGGRGPADYADLVLDLWTRTLLA
ncbi:MAG TPA: TetR/AcrR family transcriptional regulator [Ornithinibacter sp.]|nr:TetR/AcrR family transcriptional regulator [Ornithinibacter sp.]